jgi:hypothetical protein
MNRAENFLDEIIVKYCKKDYLDKKSQIKEKLEKMNSVDEKRGLNKKLSITPDQKFKKSNSLKIVNTLEYIKFGKSGTLVTEPNDNFEYKYLTENLDSLFNDYEFKKKMLKVYQGIITDINIPRILIVSHKGCIMEILNCIRKKKNIKINFINDSNNTGLYILKVYCLICGAICYSKNDNCILEFDFILFNDIDHLGPLIAK